MFFSLNSRHDDMSVAEVLKSEFKQSWGTLVTNAPAIGGFTSGGDTVDTGSVPDPMPSLFRGNVVRGGRGVFGQRHCGADPAHAGRRSASNG